MYLSRIWTFLWVSGNNKFNQSICFRNLRWEVIFNKINSRVKINLLQWKRPLNDTHLNFLLKLIVQDYTNFLWVAQSRRNSDSHRTCLTTLCTWITFFHLKMVYNGIEVLRRTSKMESFWTPAGGGNGATGRSSRRRNFL